VSNANQEAVIRVTRILRKLIRECRSIHRRRLECVIDVVSALVSCRRLTIASLGRTLRRRVAPKHSIKRVDRLFGNQHLRKDAPTLYRAMAARLITGVKRPLLLVDWTETNGMVSLVVSVPIGGRSVPLYCEAHPKSRYNNRRVVKAFLATLKTVLPPRCRPIR